MRKNVRQAVRRYTSKKAKRFARKNVRRYVRKNMRIESARGAQEATGRECLHGHWDM